MRVFEKSLNLTQICLYKPCIKIRNVLILCQFLSQNSTIMNIHEYRILCRDHEGLLALYLKCQVTINHNKGVKLYIIWDWMLLGKIQLISEANLFLHYKSMEANEPWGVANLSLWAWLAGLDCRGGGGGGGTRHCYIRTMYAVGLIVLEKFKFSHYKSMEVNDHRAW